MNNQAIAAQLPSYTSQACAKATRLSAGVGLHPAAICSTAPLSHFLHGSASTASAVSARWQMQPLHTSSVGWRRWLQVLQRHRTHPCRQLCSWQLQPAPGPQAAAVVQQLTLIWGQAPAMASAMLAGAALGPPAAVPAAVRCRSELCFALDCADGLAAALALCHAVASPAAAGGDRSAQGASTAAAHLAACTCSEHQQGVPHRTKAHLRCPVPWGWTSQIPASTADRWENFMWVVCGREW